MFLFLGKYLRRKQSGKIFNKIFWEEKKIFNGEHWHPGTWWLFIHAPWCPISPHSHCTDCNNLSWLFIQKRETRRILEGHKINRNLWQSDCWAGSHGKWSKKVVTISRLIGAGLSSSDSGAGAQIAKYSKMLTLSVGSGTCVKFSVSGFRPCMTLKLGQNEKLSGSKVVQLYLFLLSEESIQLHLVVSLMKDHYGNSFSLVSMWANAFSLTSSIHDTNN